MAAGQVKLREPLRDSWRSCSNVREPYSPTAQFSVRPLCNTHRFSLTESLFGVQPTAHVSTVAPASRKLPVGDQAP